MLTNFVCVIDSVVDGSHRQLRRKFKCSGEEHGMRPLTSGPLSGPRVSDPAPSACVCGTGLPESLDGVSLFVVRPMTDGCRIHGSPRETPHARGAPKRAGDRAFMRLPEGRAPPTRMNTWDRYRPKTHDEWADPATPASA